MYQRFIPYSLVLCLLMVACTSTELPTLIPTSTPTEIPTLVPTLQPSPVPTLQASITPEPITTPSETPLALEALTGDEIPPPFTIDLPDEWLYGYDVRVFNDVGELRAIPLALYTGPVVGGEGFIVLFWDFPNAVSGNPLLESAYEPDLYVDGLRLLRLLVIERACNIGTDVKREYSIARKIGYGTQFSAVDCPELVDTRGWFAGIWEQNVPFLFYIFTEPIDAMNGPAEQELQQILDSIVFQFDNVSDDGGG